LITAGEAQIHSFHVAADQDWVKFVAQPLSYTIRTTTALGFDVDTTLTLYDTDHTTQLGYNDDDPSNPPFSQITYTFPVTGTYFIRVKHFDPSFGGCGPEYRYTLSITTTSLSSPMPVVAHLPPRQQMMVNQAGAFLPLYWKE
jgi:hypothetical protein